MFINIYIYKIQPANNGDITSPANIRFFSREKWAVVCFCLELLELPSRAKQRILSWANGYSAAGEVNGACSLNDHVGPHLLWLVHTMYLIQ